MPSARGPIRRGSRSQKRPWWTISICAPASPAAASKSSSDAETPVTTRVDLLRAGDLKAHRAGGRDSAGSRAARPGTRRSRLGRPARHPTRMGGPPATPGRDPKPRDSRAMHGGQSLGERLAGYDALSDEPRIERGAFDHVHMRGLRPRIDAHAGSRPCCASSSTDCSTTSRSTHSTSGFARMMAFDAYCARRDRDARRARPDAGPARLLCDNPRSSGRGAAW